MNDQEYEIVEMTYEEAVKFWLEALTEEDEKTFITKSPFPTPAGTLKLLKTSTGEVLGAFLIPAGFQVDRWINRYYEGPVLVKGARQFILQEEDFTFVRELDEKVGAS